MKFRTILASTACFLAMGNMAFAAPVHKSKQKKGKPAPVVVVKEPAVVKAAEETMVRACPSFGPGYFYVPGSTTCIKFSGIVRASVSDGQKVTTVTEDEALPESEKKKREQFTGINWGTAGSFTVQSATDTDYGALRSFMRFSNSVNFGRSSIAPDPSKSVKVTDGVKVQSAYVEFGGFRFGWDSSIFSHWTGYFGSVVTDAPFTPRARARTNVMSYVYNNQSGVSAIVGVEQGTVAPAPGFAYQFTTDKKDGEEYVVIKKVETSGYMDSYVPNVVVGAKYVQGWGGVSMVSAYDSYFKKMAAKARVDANISDATVWAMVGYKARNDFFKSDRVPEDKISFDEYSVKSKHITKDTAMVVDRVDPTIYGDWGGHVAGWAGASYKFNPAFDVNVQASFDQAKNFGTAVAFNYKVTPSFTITPEVAFKKYGDYQFKANKPSGYRYDYAGKQAVNFTILFTRSF